MKKHIFLILFLFSVFLIAGCGSNNDYNKEFFDCLSEKSTLYVSTNCPACATQKSILGDGLKELNVIDCRKEPLKCQDPKIDSVPTWVINGEKYVGIKDLRELSEISGCEL